jgi:hypothetical protein
MPEYMLLSYQPVDGGPAPEQMAEQHALWMRYAQDLHDAGAFIVNRGLGGTDVATTVRVRDGEAQVTDGPFAETKEYLAGFFVIDAPDLDGALDWAARMPSAAYGSVEVRPVWGAS